MKCWNYKRTLIKKVTPPLWPLKCLMGTQPRWTFLKGLQLFGKGLLPCTLLSESSMDFRKSRASLILEEQKGRLTSLAAPCDTDERCL